VLGYVDGMAASLGMWLLAATDEIYLSSRMDEVGSVGSYVMIADFKSYFESQGLKIHEIYAPQSTDKNKDYRDAMKGDYTGIEKDLALHVNDFINFIKQRRGDKAAATEKEWSTGKMFYADDARKMGLIDGVKDLNQVISKASWLSKRKNLY
jgi:protease-4